jgi:isopentenyl-diphosphate delta-isomerase
VTDEDMLILVDEADRQIGVGPKMDVHRAGALHRAFSVFLADDDGNILLQRRALEKYHSGGLWANACCGHPRPGEATPAAAERRLMEELGLPGPLSFGFTSRYSRSVGPEMRENELVHVFFGRLAGTPRPDPREVMDVALLPLDALLRLAKDRPETLAVWLKHYLEQHADLIEQAI